MVGIVRPRVLVLTAPVDPTTDMVLTHLHSDGIPFLRLDAAQFPTEVTLTGEIAQNTQWRAALDGVSLEDVDTVYYRRPGRFEFDSSIPLDMISWCEGQARFGFWGVQAKLVKKADLRVTVVGDNVFATSIDNPGELDWRRGHDTITYQPCELPETVVAGIHRLMRSLNLFFGALDFILTDQGYQFIEINRNGQWGWIEHQTGQPISRALATALKGTPE